MRRALAYLWAFPTTAMALPIVVAAILTGGRVRVVRGVIEAHGGAARFFLRRCTVLRGGASAMALGHVVLGLSGFVLDETRAHERVHVRQAERWGPFFVPAYLIASVIAWKRGKRPYRDNAFEREAYADETDGLSTT